MRGYPQRYIVYSTETRSRAGKASGSRTLTFRLGCAAYHDLRQRGGHGPAILDFRRRDNFHDWVGELERSDVPIYIFAHDHGHHARILDWFRELGQGRYTLGPPAGVPRAGNYREPMWCLEAPPFLVRLWRPDGQQLILADTMNWLEESLEGVGGWLRFPRVVLPGQDAPVSAWFDHCRRDVELVDRALGRLWQFWSDLGMGSWDLTRASGAMHLWRARYGRRRVRPPGDASVLSLDRHAYYGGRQEAFQLGRVEGPVFQVDVSSMYPYVMQENLYPCEVIDAQTAEIGPRDGAPGNPSQTTAEVWIDSPSTPYPVRCRDGTCYCTGRVRTILCGPELRAAVEAGHIVRHGRLVRYRMSALFTDFVHALWAVRLDAKLCGDRVSDGLAKALMNSLYGKFGQRGGSWITEGKDYAPNFFGAGYLYGPRPEDDYESRVIAGVFQVRRKDMLARGTFVPIAAYTTSYARVYMDVIRGIVGEDQVYYQAVDSLLISELGRDRLQARDLVADATLGALRVAGTFAWVDVKALGWLDRPDRALKPGVPGDAVPVTADVFAQDRRQSCAASLRQGKASCVSIRETLTHLRAGYRRGEVLANGRVRPWVISNWHLTPERQRDQPLLHQRDRR